MKRRGVVAFHQGGGAPVHSSAVAAAAGTAEVDVAVLLGQCCAIVLLLLGCVVAVEVAAAVSKDKPSPPLCHYSNGAKTANFSITTLNYYLCCCN